MKTLATCKRAEVQRAGMYALGMTDAPQLADLAENGDDFQRRAAQWWTRVGPAIHESAEA
jgi:hypothetical protein